MDETRSQRLTPVTSRGGAPPRAVRSDAGHTCFAEASAESISHIPKAHYIIYLSTTGYSLYPSSFLTCVVPPSSFQQKSMMRPTSCS